MSALLKGIVEFLCRIKKSIQREKEEVKENVDTMISYVENPDDSVSHFLELMNKFSNKQHTRLLIFLYTSSKLPENEFM